MAMTMMIPLTQVRSNVFWVQLVTGRRGEPGVHSKDTFDQVQSKNSLIFQYITDTDTDTDTFDQVQCYILAS